MDIHFRLRNRIIATTLGVTLTASANAFPRVNIVSEPEPIAPWSDPSSPLALYGFQSFSQSVYRPIYDELLTQQERTLFEDLYASGNEKLNANNDRIAQSTLLAYGILDVVFDSEDEEPEEILIKIRKRISDFTADPNRTTQEIAQYLLDTEQVFLAEQDDDVPISPPETRLGAKVTLENLQIRLKQQDLTLSALDELFERLANERIVPTIAQIIVEMDRLIQVLDQCPEPDAAMSRLYYLNDQEIGSEMSLQR